MPEDTRFSQLIPDLTDLAQTVPGILDPALDERLTAHEALPDAHHPQNHSHPTHGDINFTGTVSANGDAGLTGQKVIAGYTFTFKKGLLVGFQAP